MNWQEVCEHPGLQNLPFKIELDEKGKILMSPVKVYHSVYQSCATAKPHYRAKHPSAADTQAVRLTFCTLIRLGEMQTL